MLLSAFFLTLAVLVADAASPNTPAPAGCQPSFSGSFAISTVVASAAPSAIPAPSPGSPATPGGYGSPSPSSPSFGSSTACNSPSTVSLTLSRGVLLDSMGRTGEIAANQQLQFDSPPQSSAIYTGGFSACANSSLALGGSTIFYSCVSGGFSNLFDMAISSQCTPVNIQIEPC